MENYDDDRTQHPLFDRQLALEEEMVSRGMNTFRKKAADAKAAGRESATPSGAYLVKKAIQPVSKAIQDFLNTTNSGKAGRKHIASKYLNDVPPDVAAFVGLRTCLNIISARTTLQNAAITIGAALETEARLTYFEKEDKDVFKQATRVAEKSGHDRYRSVVYTYIAGKNDIDLPTWPTRDKLLLGQKLIEIIVDVTGYFEIISNYGSTSAQKRGAGAYTYHLIGSQKCLDWMTKLGEYAELTTPEYMPTIIPPRPWAGPYGGGYYSVCRPLNLVKGAASNYLEELAMSIDDMPVLYEAINAMQDTGYTINEQVLSTMRQLWEAGGDVAGVPNRDNYTLPRCPMCGAEIPYGENRGGVKHPCFSLPEAEATLKAWKQEAAAIYEKNITTLSRRFQFAKTLWLGEKFKDEAAIYFPMQLDFRGRCYAVPSFLNPQGADPAKGLLLFQEGKHLATEEAVKWLAIHGANTWGNDKVSLDDRYTWVKEQEANILAIADNPYDNRMWYDADKPWQFLAFCFEWAEYKKTGPAFVSHLPVAMDGTCNGLQIFSLMLRDPVGGMATNLLPADKPQDIYQIVADKTTEKLREKAKDGGLVFRKDTEEIWYDEKDMASRLLALGLTRKTTKRQVMVLPYGGTFQSCCEYTLEHLTERINDGGGGTNTSHGITRENSYAASRFLAALIWDSIGETVVAARVAMGFLQKLASLAAAEGLPVNWQTPIGFLVSQAYYNYDEFRIKTKIGASVVRLVVREEGEELSIDRRRQRNGISPNFVHSLDAAAMCQSIHLARKEDVNSFMMVHDSYGTLATDAPSMARCLRTAFVSLFTERDVLAELRDSVAAMLPKKRREELPELPEKGSLDISQVLSSPFFFA